MQVRMKTEMTMLIKMEKDMKLYVRMKMSVFAIPLPTWCRGPSCQRDELIDQHSGARPLVGSSVLVPAASAIQKSTFMSLEE